MTSMTRPGEQVRAAVTSAPVSRTQPQQVRPTRMAACSKMCEQPGTESHTAPTTKPMPATSYTCPSQAPTPARRAPAPPPLPPAHPTAQPDPRTPPTTAQATPASPSMPIAPGPPIAAPITYAEVPSQQHDHEHHERPRHTDQRPSSTGGGHRPAVAAGWARAGPRPAPGRRQGERQHQQEGGDAAHSTSKTPSTTMHEADVHQPAG
jgi:hypothetical protein